MQVKMSDKIFITGKPGCGKSTLINKIINNIKNKYNIAGIITPEIRKNNQRTGFKIIDLASGQEEILASVDIKGKPRVSKYGVNIDGINKITHKFLESFEKADYIFIDELGPMEFFSKDFKKMLDKVFDSDKNIIVTLHRNLINKYKNKGKLFYLERDNFDQVLKEVLDIL